MDSIDIQSAEIEIDFICGGSFGVARMFQSFAFSTPQCDC